MHKPAVSLVTMQHLLSPALGPVIQSLCSNAATHGFLNFMTEFCFEQNTPYVITGMFFNYLIQGVSFILRSFSY